MQIEIRLSAPAFMTLAAITLLGTEAFAVGERYAVGDPTNGKKLFSKECAGCHGADGLGGRTGVSLGDSGRLNLIPNERMFVLIKDGAGLKKPKDHALGAQLGSSTAVQFLNIWDVVSYVRSVHMGLDEFFPSASRYVCKTYTIDQYGLERIEKAAGKAPSDKTAAVFTFFNFAGEEGRLSYVPQDPIKLDQLKKDLKAGYLVFLPFKTEGFSGELGIGMDSEGKMTTLAVHSSANGADLLNKSLSRFRGLGKKGQKEHFKIGGGKSMDKLAEDLFPTYLSAMETVTMYDREEKERTWADD